MEEYIFQKDYNNKFGKAKVKLLLIHFMDENKVHFFYSPHLDLTGYGYDAEEAKKSFSIVFEDFIDYTLKKKTLHKVLTNLGWALKGGSVKKPKKVLAPSISIIKDNKHVSEIFDKYPVNTYHQEVGIPIYA